MIEHHPTAEELKWFEPSTVSAFSEEFVRLTFGNPSNRQNPQDSDKSRETYEMTPGSLAHRDLMRRVAQPEHSAQSNHGNEKVANAESGKAASDRQMPQDADKSRETYEMTPGSLAHRDLMRRLAEPDQNRKSSERSDKVTNILPDVYIDF